MGADGGGGHRQPCRKLKVSSAAPAGCPFGKRTTAICGFHLDSKLAEIGTECTDFRFSAYTSLPRSG